MNFELSRDHRNTLLFGGIFVILAMGILYGSMWGPSGGLLLTPIITGPMSIIGGILIGYSLAEAILETDRRVPRVVFAVFVAMAVFSLQIGIYAVMNPGINLAVDWFGLAKNGYPIGLAIALSIVGVIEVSFIISSRVGTVYSAS